MTVDPVTRQPVHRLAWSRHDSRPLPAPPAHPLYDTVDRAVVEALRERPRSRRSLRPIVTAAGIRCTPSEDRAIVFCLERLAQRGYIVVGYCDGPYGSERYRLLAEPRIPDQLWWQTARDRCPRCQSIDVSTYGQTPERTEADVAEIAECEDCDWYSERAPRDAEWEALQDASPAALPDVLDAVLQRVERPDLVASA